MSTTHQTERQIVNYYNNLRKCAATKRWRITLAASCVAAVALYMTTNTKALQQNRLLTVEEFTELTPNVVHAKAISMQLIIGAGSAHYGFAIFQIEEIYKGLSHRAEWTALVNSDGTTQKVLHDGEYFTLIQSLMEGGQGVSIKPGGEYILFLADPIFNNPLYTENKGHAFWPVVHYSEKFENKIKTAVEAAKKE
jgi:hypothetical protein